MIQRFGRLNSLAATLLVSVFFGAVSLSRVPEAASGRAPVSGPSAESVMQRVRFHVRQGDFTQALSLLEPYIAAPAEFPTHFSDYLVILAWAGRPAEALARFDALPPAFPRRPYLLRNMAKAYYDRGDYARAAALYCQSAAQEPTDAIALEGWLMALMADGRYEQAGRTLAGAAGPAAESLPVKLLQANLLIHRNRFLEALDLYDALMTSHPAQRALIAKARDDLIAGLEGDRQARLLAALEAAAAGGGRTVQFYALCLVLARRYEAAVELLETRHVVLTEMPGDRMYWLAWAYFKAGRPRQALDGFNLLLAREPDTPRARVARIYCHAALGDSVRAWEEIAALHAGPGDDVELMYARAYVYEKQGLFWDAVKVYERILRHTPDDRIAGRLRIRAMADLGATSAAARQAERLLPEDTHLQATLQQDAALDYLDWEEARAAVRRLEKLVEVHDRFAFDYIVALAEAQQYGRAIEIYDRLTAAGHAPPSRARSAAADACLAEKQPERALSLYNQVLVHSPEWFEARMGKFYALQTLRRWQGADAWLADMKAGIPSTITAAGGVAPNPERFELALATAWYLAHQDRLTEAESAFRALHEKAPANLDARSGLAHMYLWRGLPRKAMQAFDIIDTMDPGYRPAQTGRILALDALAEKDRARALAADLLEQYPQDRHVQQTWRALQVEQMKEWRTDVLAQHEDDDSSDILIRTGLSAPLTLDTRLFGYAMWRRTRVDRDTAFAGYFRRVGVGLDHRPGSDWRLRPAVSMDYDDGREPGASLRVDYTPTDQWTFGIYGDSFSAAVAGRARAAGIEASQAGAEAVWRPGEWRQATAGYTRSEFSDDNLRDEIMIGYDQNLWVKHDWRMRIFVELYATWNSKGDETVYFNPERAWTFSLSHMTEQTVCGLYQRSFIHRLYVTAGLHGQAGFGSDIIGSVRYEQEHAFNDRQALQAGIGVGRRVYDGEAVSDLTVSLGVVWRF